MLVRRAAATDAGVRPSAEQLAAIDALRAVAAIGVLVVHVAQVFFTQGVVVRWADAFPTSAHQQAVGKLVRRDHVKTDQHWMHGEVTANGLAAADT